MVEDLEQSVNKLINGYLLDPSGCNGRIIGISVSSFQRLPRSEMPVGRVIRKFHYTAINSYIIYYIGR